MSDSCTKKVLKLLLFTLIAAAVYVKADECKTPNNETAQCISLFSCPTLLSAAPDPSKRDFLTRSSCGGTPIDPLVCCGTKSNYTVGVETKAQQRSNVDNLLPSSKICGQQHSDDYFHDSNDTVISEFPWLAFVTLSGRNENGEDVPKQFCTGCLINNRYVLTSAFCLFDYKLKPTSVRLGEYHLYNKTDCMTEKGLEECSDPVRNFGIEKIIPHPEYDFEEYPRDNIALVRLNQPVRYSDYIRPICLPLSKASRPKTGDILKQAGWVGYEVLDAVKKGVTIKLATYEECNWRVEFITTSLEDMPNRLLCGKLTNDSVFDVWRDTGAPLMSYSKARWYLEGICSDTIFAKNVGMIYIKVAYYVEWIKANIEP